MGAGERPRRKRTCMVCGRAFYDEPRVGDWPAPAPIPRHASAHAPALECFGSGLPGVGRGLVSEREEAPAPPPP